MMAMLLQCCLLLPIADGAPIEATVGMTGKIVALVLPGSELEAKPYSDRRIPVLLRLLSVKKVADGYRYDIEFQGFDPGNYDLRKYLQRQDGSSLEGVPAIPVKVTPLLPPGQVEPHTLQIDGSFGMGGYRWWLLAGGLIWLGVLVMIVYYGFWPQRKAQLGASAAPVTLADRLKPLVERAMSGQAPPEELATLERYLLTWWRRKLNLAENQVSASVKQLREHAEAGPLLQQLELWLHRPGTKGQVDVAQLLAPYRHVAASELLVPEGSA